MKLFHCVLLVLVAVVLCGCQAVKQELLRHELSQVNQSEREYFADSNNDLMADVQASGLDEVDFIARQVEYILFDIVLSQTQERDVLVVIFLGVISDPQFKTAKDQYLGFIGSPEIKQFVLPKLWAKPEYASLTQKQRELVYRALLQHYQKKIESKSDPEGYAQERIDLVFNNL